MVRPRKPVPDTPADRRRRGQALKKAVHVARARAGITSDLALSIAAPVDYETLMNWWSGKTRPRGAELQKVAFALKVPYADLEAAYEGRDPEPAPLTDAVAALVSAVAELVHEMREDRERGQDAASAMVRAAQALASTRRPGGSRASSGPPVPDGTTG